MWSLFVVFFLMSDRVPNFCPLPRLEGPGRMALWGVPSRDMLGELKMKGLCAVVTLQGERRLCSCLEKLKQQTF